MDEQNESKALILSQAEAMYTTVSPKTGEAQCANCRWYTYGGIKQVKNGDMDDYEMESYSYCQIVEPYPDAIMPTGYCDRWEKRPNVMLQMDTVLMEHSKNVTITPKPLRAGITDRLFKRDKSETLFGYTPDGMRLAFHITSNGYEDREQEHVATNALKSYVASAWNDDGFAGDNKLLFWHDKNLHIGDIVWADVQDNFLVEISQERDNPVAKSVWDYWQRTAQGGEQVWGTSHGFMPIETHNDDGKLVYDKIRKTETSVLLLSSAANQLTVSEVLGMAKSKQEVLADIFGTEEAVEWLSQGMQGLTLLANHLQENGVESKSVDVQPEETAPVSNVMEKMASAFVELVDAQGGLDERIEALEKSADEATTKQADALVTITEQLKAIQEFINQTPKSVTDKKSSNAKPEQIEQSKARAADYDPAFPGMGVPKGAK